MLKQSTGNRVLSVRQPYATLLCAGVKDVENRSWSTKYRGTVLIHSSATWSEPANWLFDRTYPLPVFDEFHENIDIDLVRVTRIGKILDLDDTRLVLKDEKHRTEFELLKTEIAEQLDNDDTLFLTSAIVGQIDIVDIVDDYDSPWSEPGNNHWICKNPILYATPIENIKGHLRLWRYDTIFDTTPKDMVKE